MRVLVIEDEEVPLLALQDRLEHHGFMVVAARTQGEALTAVKADANFFAVLVDGWLDGPTDTCHLIELMRKLYNGHMIAMSSRSETRTAQMAAGCSHESWNKNRAASLVIDLYRREPQGVQAL
ncbi:MAG: response regulator [Candidatus Uhrbacteria bacterium]|nr:response regulator [Candidatus Uhrbacteria bacterium]